MKSSIRDNLIKNILILAIAAWLYPIIQNSLAQLKFEQTNDFLLVISMFLVTACFANFAFTYEKSKLNSKVGKILAHSSTFVFILLIILLLECIVSAVRVVYPSFYHVILGLATLLYLGIVLYDFWDLVKL
ncbi:MAG: hypothetical protein WC480_01595 [Patescibacteria group bacterium]